MDVLAAAFMCALAVLAGIALARGVPRAREALINLFLGVLLLLALRASAWLVPSRLTNFCAAVAPLAMVPIDWSLNPIVDLVHPTLSDSTLLAVDRWLFGETPSVLLERYLTPWLTELLLYGYLSYFLIVALPLVLLWIFRDQEIHAEYSRSVVLLYVANLCFYILVPAIGPRFQLADVYSAPLKGVLFGERIRDLFLQVPFYRDCFPSGHTAATLLALVYTRKRLPVFFWVALPVGALCISATVLCRFHYAIDLLCALPLCWFALVGARVLTPEAAETVFARLRATAD
jgi:hypothetical protein